MSLDHIKPKSRFPESAQDIENLEWVHTSVNLAKRALTKDEFLDMVKLIADNT